VRSQSLQELEPIFLFPLARVANGESGTSRAVIPLKPKYGLNGAPQHLLPVGKNSSCGLDEREPQVPTLPRSVLATNLGRSGVEEDLQFFQPLANFSWKLNPTLCHPERTPDFLLRRANQRPRMRLSVRKAAGCLSTPRSLTGNPEGAEGLRCAFPERNCPSE
jgi:hypothetical protein